MARTCGRKVLICGGRDFKDELKIHNFLVSEMPSLVVTGGAAGADKIADEIAEELGIDRVIFPANWKGQGKAAGHIRNQRMIDTVEVDLVVAFEGGTGTNNMVKKALKAGIEVKDMRHGEDDQDLWA